MKSLSYLLLQIKDEQKNFWRNVPAWVFTFLFTILFLVLFSALAGNSKIQTLNGIKFEDYYVPSIITLGIISSCYTSLAMTLISRRESGNLKALRATPISPIIYLGGLIGSALIVSLILVIITVSFGISVYGTSFPHHLVALFISLAVGTFAFCSFGIAVSSIIPNQEAAPAVINGIILPLYFISGTFYALGNSTLLARIAMFFPVRPFILSVFTSFDPLNNSNGYDMHALLSLLAWGVISALFSAYRFRFLPKQAH